MKTNFILDENSYYSLEANQLFWSVSTYKSFVKCEAAAMAKLRGEYVEPVTRAQLVGQFFDCYFDNTLDKFKSDHPEIFTLKGELYSHFKKANEMIARVVQDSLFMQFMSGEKQKIMTAEMFGVEWKIKIDSFVSGKCISDLKSSANFRSVPHFRYDIQGAVYQKVAELNGYGQLPFYLAICTKEVVPNFDVFQVTQPCLDLAFKEVGENMPRFIAVKRGEEEPIACGECYYCRSIKKARVRNYAELLEG